MRDRHRQFAATAAAIGAALGVAFVRLGAPAPPPCTTLENGLLACMPVLVVGPPSWAYVAGALLGALLAGSAVVALPRIRPRAH